jgi:cell division septation protein DedD
MKQADSKDRSSVMYIGKGIIIAAIIITASLCFTLGFFVGKSFRNFPVEQLSASPRQNVIERQTVEPLKKDDTVSPQPVPMEKPQIQGPRETEPQPSPDPKKAQLSQETPKNRQAQESNLVQKTPENDKAAKTRKYTVQVEAFKSSSTAYALNEKLNKKGYKTSVISVKTKKNENLFKVIVGEFTNRKEAEVMSVKLKKTENLQHAFVTFVTFKSE